MLDQQKNPFMLEIWSLNWNLQFNISFHFPFYLKFFGILGNALDFWTAYTGSMVNKSPMRWPLLLIIIPITHDYVMMIPQVKKCYDVILYIWCVRLIFSSFHHFVVSTIYLLCCGIIWNSINYSERVVMWWNKHYKANFSFTYH